MKFNPYTITQNFDLSKQKIFHHGLKGHLKISKTAKFGCEML